MKMKIKIWGNEFDFQILKIFKTFLTNRGKNEEEDKKIWKNDLEF